MHVVLATATVYGILLSVITAPGKSLISCVKISFCEKYVPQTVTLKRHIPLNPREKNLLLPILHIQGVLPLVYTWVIVIWRATN